MTLARFALWLFVVALTGYLMIVGRNLLLPLVLAVVLWYLIDTLAAFFGHIRAGRRRLPRAVALTLAVVTIGLLVWVLGNMIRTNIEAVIEAAPSYQAKLERIVADVSRHFGVENTPTIAELFAQFDLRQVLSELAGAAASVAGQVGIVLIYTGFLFVEQLSFDRKLSAFFTDAEHEAKTRLLLHRISEDIRIYIRIKTFLALITALIGYLIMTGVGLDFAGFWAVMIFFFYYIPTVGSLLAIISPTLLTLVQFESLTPFLIVLIAMGTVQIITANVIEPAMLGRSLNLSPFVIILSLMVFGTIWGVVGMFLCVPIMVIAMIVLANFPQTRPIAVMLSADGRIFRPDRLSPPPAAASAPEAQAD